MYYKPTIKATFLLLFGFIQVTTFAQNLLKNPDCELPSTSGTIPSWTNVVGNLWNVRQLDPLAQNGVSYFSPGQIKNAELSQTIDVSDYACSIDAGIQSFIFGGYVYSFNQQPQDEARIIVQYLSVTNAILTSYDSGNKTPLGIWEKLTNTTLAPVGTRSIRIRLISTRQSGTDNDGDYDNLSLIPSPAKVTIDTVQITSAKCNNPNGKITVKTTGGANLQFKINNGTATTDSVFTNLLGGNYTVVVTSGTCTVTKNIVVPTTIPPTIDSLKTDPSVCSRPNGKITVFGRSNYKNLVFSLDSVSFRNGKIFDSLAANTYKITLKDSLNCISQQTVTVIDKPAPTISSLKEVPSVCGKNNGKLMSVTTLGGTLPLSFSIDSIRFSSISTFDTLKGGTYKLIVRDSNGCIASRPFVIKKFDLPAITAVDVTPPSCKGGDGVLKISASSLALPLGFSLDSVRFTPKDTFSSLKSGIYTITVRDSFGCISKQNVSMPDPKLPIIEDIQSSIAECGQASASILVKAKSPIGSVKYSLDTANFQVENTFRNNKKGKYRVFVEDTKGCRASAEIVVKSNCTVFIPTAFSPNGDGHNDFLSIFGNAEDVEKIITFQVFNRWGDLVFNDPTTRLNDPTSGWDGTFRSQVLSNDVFVVIVKVQMKGGEILEKMGDVLLSK
jgi:gliding motility-associated-like protein